MLENEISMLVFNFANHVEFLLSNLIGLLDYDSFFYDFNSDVREGLLVRKDGFTGPIWPNVLQHL